MAGFDIERIDSATVNASWVPVNSAYADHYSIYYTTDLAQGGWRAHNEEAMMEEFPARDLFGVIGGLDAGQKYLFWLTVTYNIEGIMYEGEGTDCIEYGTSLGISYSSLLLEQFNA